MLVTLRRDPVFALTIPSKIQLYQACSHPTVASLGGEGAHVVRTSGRALACPDEDFQTLAEAVLTHYHLPRNEREHLRASRRDSFLEHFERERLLKHLE
jgi:hypothetical protein